MTHPTDRLTEAREHLSSAFEILDDVRLEEPEAGALLTLRSELAHLIRRTNNLTVFATMREDAS